ncbi:Laminin subunit alpha [Eumeta japonica]|uniref:Laminin subunit alpha n=1 Tax=Eumeta variegata TaxID=151549 RepID=A0A4C2ACN5_EUMVA|nr:Laminin subunit alpha [Eumeta japonica]
MFEDEPRSNRLDTDKVNAILEKIERDRHIHSYHVAEKLGFDHKTVLTQFKKAGYTKKFDAWVHTSSLKEINNESYTHLDFLLKLNETEPFSKDNHEFHVAYVFVRMGNSPRPGVWALEKSTDYGKTYKPWQYFADSPQDCQRYFGKKSLQPITEDDSVICSTEYSKIVPLEGGEIPISLLNYRPSANKYFNSSVLQEWTRATNVRLRFIRTKNLLGHLMSVARQDPTVTRRVRG